MGEPDTRTLSRPDADPADYRQDFQAWTVAQGARLRRAATHGRTEGLDWENLAEEIEALGRGELDALESALEQVLIHLLKLEYSPAADPHRGWEESVDEHRRRVPRALKNSPSLRPRLPATLVDAWPPARRSAARALKRDKIDPDILPKDCPYTLDQILDEDWWSTNWHGLE